MSPSGHGSMLKNDAGRCLRDPGSISFHRHYGVFRALSFERFFLDWNMREPVRRFLSSSPPSRRKKNNKVTSRFANLNTDRRKKTNERGFNWRNVRREVCRKEGASERTTFEKVCFVRSYLPIVVAKSAPIEIINGPKQPTQQFNDWHARDLRDELGRANDVGEFLLVPDLGYGRKTIFAEDGNPHHHLQWNGENVKCTYYIYTYTYVLPQ